jgi:hypothetical protein
MMMMMIKPWLASRPVWRPGTATLTWLGCMSLPKHAVQGAPTNCSTRSLTLRPAVTESAWCWMAESNIRATRSYRSYGFVETGRRRPMDRDPSIIEIEFAYPLARMQPSHT